MPVSSTQSIRPGLNCSGLGECGPGSLEKWVKRQAWKKATAFMAPKLVSRSRRSQRRWQNFFVFGLETPGSPAYFVQ